MRLGGGWLGGEPGHEQLVAQHALDAVLLPAHPLAREAAALVDGDGAVVVREDGERQLAEVVGARPGLEGIGVAVDVYIKKMNDARHDKAMKKASAAKSKMRSLLKDEDSDEYQAIHEQSVARIALNDANLELALVRVLRRELLRICGERKRARRPYAEDRRGDGEHLRSERRNGAPDAAQEGRAPPAEEGQAERDEVSRARKVAPYTLPEDEVSPTTDPDAARRRALAVDLAARGVAYRWLVSDQPEPDDRPPSLTKRGTKLERRVAAARTAQPTPPRERHAARR